MSIVKINILNHADYAGEIRRTNDSSGLAYFYSAIESVRENNQEHTLLLDAGDNFKHLLWDDFIQDAIKLLREDVFELGNHDFDKGKDELERRVELLKGKCEVICSNIVQKEDDSFARGVKPYVVLEKGGIKYGIIGACSEYTPYMVTASYFAPYKAISAIDCFRKYITMARNEGAEIIICLCHFPFYFKDGLSGELIDCYNGIKDLQPDVMIGGHIPGDFSQVVDETVICKAGFGGKSLANAILYFDEESRKVVGRDAELIDVYNSDFVEDEEIKKIADKAMEPYNYYFEEEVAWVNELLPMRLDFESPMGNILADGIRDYFKTDFAYFNCTSCGRSIPAGKMTRAVIADALAYNNDLYTAVYTGKQIWDLFEHIHVPERFGNNGNIMFSGLNVKMDHSQPTGSKVVYVKELDGSDIDFDKSYTVVTSEYMSNGGNDTSEISGQVEWTNTHILVHDVLYEYFHNLKVVDKVELGRYIFIGKPENDNSPW